MVTNAIEKAQRKVEGRNFDMRKQLLEYDDVANEQRKVIYHMRNSLLAADEIGQTIAEFRREVLDASISAHIPPQSLPEQWDIPGLEAVLYSDFGARLPIQQWLDEDEKLYEETLREKIMQALLADYREKEELAGPEALRTFEKQIALRVLDDLWKEHLSTMDHLRHGIHLRGYAQKNPKQEYKRESFALFQTCWNPSSATASACFPTCRFAAKTRPKKRPVCAARPRSWPSACSSSTPRCPRWISRKNSPRWPASRTSRWRRCAPSRRSVATSPAHVARARSTSIATDRSSKPDLVPLIHAATGLCRSRRFSPRHGLLATTVLKERSMAVGLGPLPTLHPVPGFELGIASAGIKRPGRKDVVVMRCAEGSRVAE